MAKKKRKKPSYQFISYDTTSFMSFDEHTEEEWKSRMPPDLLSKEILKDTTYMSTMDKPIVRTYDDLSLSFLRILERNRRNIYKTHHKFLVLELKDSSEVSHYISFDKNKKGIIVQYSRKKEDVVKKLKGKNRYEGTKKELKIEEVTCTDYTKPLNKILCLDILTVKNIVDEWQTALDYSLGLSNCQSLVLDIKQILTDASKGVNFIFPGTDKYVTLSYSDRREIINLLENVYSKGLFESGMTMIPEEVNPRILVPLQHTELVMESEETSDYCRKELKDELDRFIIRSLEKYSNENKTGIVYFVNLNKRKMEDNLKKAAEEYRNHHQGWSKKKCKLFSKLFWSITLDGVIISEYLGVVILHTTDDQQVKEEKDIISLLEKKEIVMKEICNELVHTGVNKQNEESVEIPINVITIGEQDGNHIRVKKSSEGVEEKFFEEELKKILDEIKKSVDHKANHKTIKQIKYLTGCFFFLQNVEDTRGLLFDRISKQKWIEDDGSTSKDVGFVWSRRQKLIIDSIESYLKTEKQAFNQKLVHFVNGCPGSGKTLILLHAIRYYCTQNFSRHKKSLYIANSRFVLLHKQVKEKLQDLIDDNRVEICTEISNYNSKEDVGLIVYDEVSDQDRYEFFRRIDDALQSGIHIISASMESYIDFLDEKGHKFNKFVLGDENYRSSHDIIKFLNECLDKAGPANIVKMTPRLTQRLPSSIHLNYMVNDSFENMPAKGKNDTSEKREKFVEACFEYILRLKSEFTSPVLIYTVYGPRILERIRLKLGKESREKNGRIDKDQFDNLSFQEADHSQGAEFVTTIGIYDDYIFTSMLTALTRTSLSAHLLINTDLDLLDDIIQYKIQ